MEATPGRRYEAPSVAPETTRVCERVTFRPGVRFAVVTGAESVDPLSGELATGVLPESYHPLIGLLEALVPPGGRVLDLGMHVGAFTLTAAALGYEVLGVEASPRNASLLRASLERNGFDRVRLVHAAVSDRPGTLEFCQAGPYGHVAAPGSWAADVVVPALAVDDLLDEHGWDRVDFIKMDIEGSEVAGLRGLARRLGRSDAPPLFIESNGHTLGLFGQTTTALKSALEGFGYRNYQVAPGRLRPVRSTDLQPSTCVDYLAMKDDGRLKAMGRTWRVDPPPGPGELIRDVLASCHSSNPADRDYIAGALAGAPPSFLSRGPILRAVRSLRADEIESVRSNAASIPLPTTRLAWVARLLEAIPR